MNILKFIRELFLENISIKVISLIIAFFIWVMVVSEKKSEIGFVLPLEYQNIPKKMEIIGSPVQNAEVHVRGPRREINGLSSRQIKVIINLIRDKKGKNIHFLANEEINLGKGIEIVQITPYKISVVLDESASKKIPIMPVILGKPADGFRVEKTVVSPELTTIVGPKSEVDKITYVRTETLNFENIKANFSKRVHLTLENPNVRLVDKTPPNVTVVISEIFDHKLFKNNLIENQTGISTLRITPSSVKVVLRGSLRHLNALTPQDYKLFIDKSLVPKDKLEFEVAPKLSLPEELSLEEIIPEKVKCSIR